MTFAAADMDSAPTSPTPVDLLILARWVVPVEPENCALPYHAVAIRGGRIIALCPQQQALAAFEAAETIRLNEHVLIPGLINAHTHAAMSLLRGYADDLPLMRWLQEAIWPAEARHVDADFVRDGSLLAAAEMLRGGITHCMDMYFHPEAAAEAFTRVGIRATVGMIAAEFPTPYAANLDEYLARGLDARKAWQHHPLIDFNLAPHAPYTLSNEGLQRVASLAAEIGCPIQIHVHETRQEIENSLCEHRMRPLARLAALGLLSPDTIAIHAVHLNDHDLELLAREQVGIVHCPSSNMKLASGIAPIERMRARGLRIGLGSDGAASNNRLDILQEMRHAALLAKVGSGDAAALPAATALRMATLEAARLLGKADQLGSIEPGKQADLCALRIDELVSAPCYDPISHLVYVLGRDQVSDVWIDGQARMRNGMLLHISHRELLAIARLWQTRIGS